MTAPLAGRVALVTGAGRGIGRAIAFGLAVDGATVVVNDRDAAPAHAVVAEIESRGGSALPFVASVTDHDGCTTMIDELGGVDILVSNAGVASSGRSLLRTHLDEATQLMDINVFAALTLCQAVLPAMRERGDGRIVVVSSAAVEALPPKGGPYNMAKAALEAFAVTLANEERRHGVRVNIVRPGFVDTRLARLVADRVTAAGTPNARHDDAGPRPLSPAMLDPEAIADAVRFYVSDAAAHVTGQTLLVS